ncbi:4Fe-4S binding protein [Dyadobacter sp. 3J3]|uniref:4Fe-4S binding protein n=1 Tax=Dyadobacter sp. 3J3 TaxID=2606600 RepID=UPI0013579AFD|nr:4Fe-4S binding protein [Dyadobacter sp. 3J3]
MKLTLRHLFQARRRRSNNDIRSNNFYDLQDGMVTIQYPQETIPIPDNGRYRLHNEMDDCIVCDKCVKVCPVDCIEIEPIKAIEEVGRASDGSPIRLYAAKFDIDMAKCCYCGLCTTVCPTECLTMTKTFDYSEVDIRDMVYNFGNLTADEAQEKRDLLEQFQKEKEALKAAQKPAAPSEVTAKTPVARPAFKPTIKPKQEEIVAKEESAEGDSPRPKPVFQPRKPALVEAKSESDITPEEIVEKPVAKLPFKPSMKPKVAAEEINKESNMQPGEAPKAKPAFRPSMKPKADTAPESPVSSSEEIKTEEVKVKPAFRPTMKPKVDTPPATEITPEIPAESVTPKPAFRPTMKPKTPVSEIPETVVEKSENEEVKAKPAFRPTMKPKVESPSSAEIIPEISVESVAPKPAFRPTMKPKMPVSEIPEVRIEKSEIEEIKAKPVFRPTMKPKAEPTIENTAEITNENKSDQDIIEAKEETPKPKPAFRPTMKPKPKSPDQE